MERATSTLLFTIFLESQSAVLVCEMHCCITQSSDFGWCFAKQQEERDASDSLRGVLVGGEDL